MTRDDRELRAGLTALPPLEAAHRICRDREFIQRLDTAEVDRARLIVELYEGRALSRGERRRTGIYYTPPNVVRAMLDRLPTNGLWLDPAAGAGAFLIEIVRRFGEAILDRLHACDIDTEALDAAAFAMEAVLGPPSRTALKRWRKSQTHTIDFLREDVHGLRPDVIAGNPPYGLSDDRKLQTRFPELQGEIDLYACFLLKAGEVVTPEGVVALLVPDTWMTNARAGSLRSRLARRGLSRLVDFGKPFATARDTRVHAVFMHRDADTCEVESTRGEALLPMASIPRTTLSEQAERGWMPYRTTGEVEACRVIEAMPPLKSRFDVIYGLRTGDNARHVVSGTGAIPLIAGRDFDAYDRNVTARHLRSGKPFATALLRQQGRWKIGIQRIRTNSTVPWRRWVEGALLQPNEAGLDSLSLIAEMSASAEPPESLLGLLGVLNSSILNRWYRLTFTDVNVKPVYLETIPIPPIDDRLIALVRRRLESRHDLALERAIDRLVARAYGLTEAQITCLESGFWESHPAPLPPLDDALALAA